MYLNPGRGVGWSPAGAAVQVSNLARRLSSAMRNNSQALIFGKYKQSLSVPSLSWFSLENDIWVPRWSQLATGQPQEALLLEGCDWGCWSWEG